MDSLLTSTDELSPIRYRQVAVNVWSYRAKLQVHKSFDPHKYIVAVLLQVAFDRFSIEVNSGCAWPSFCHSRLLCSAHNVYIAEIMAETVTSFRHIKYW